MSVVMIVYAHLGRMSTVTRHPGGIARQSSVGRESETTCLLVDQHPQDDDCIVQTSHQRDEIDPRRSAAAATAATRRRISATRSDEMQFAQTAAACGCFILLLMLYCAGIKAIGQTIVFCTAGNI